MIAFLRQHLRAGTTWTVSDERGAVLTEFAMLLPVFAFVLMGSIEASHTMFEKALLQGELQKASRDSGIETKMTTAAQDTIDNKVKNQVKALKTDATVTVSRRYYRSFAATSQTMEKYTDTNNNGTCDNNEPYDDDNRNSLRDNAGTAGTGSAKDTVVYTVTMTYKRTFPLTKIVNIFWPGRGLPENVTLKAVTVMNNQPFGDQLAALVGHCTP